MCPATLRGSALHRRNAERQGSWEPSFEAAHHSGPMGVRASQARAAVAGAREKKCKPLPGAIREGFPEAALGSDLKNE